jgi:predicted RNase H-like nuclease (RuvC/YqgF family)
VAEINAYMNGYQPEGDTEFLTAALEAHKKAIEKANFETETAKEFLYQHIQTNKELENEVERLRNAVTELHGDSWSKTKEFYSYESAIDFSEKQLQVSQQKAERLEKALKEIRFVSRYSDQVDEIVKQALETEEKG